MSGKIRGEHQDGGSHFPALAQLGIFQEEKPAACDFCCNKVVIGPYQSKFWIETVWNSYLCMLSAYLESEGLDKDPF